MSKEKEMSFLDHLEELRKRLIWIVLSIAVGGTLMFVFQSQVESVLSGPRNSDFVTYKLLCNLSQASGFDDSLCFTDVDFELQGTTMLANFTAHFMVSIIGGIIIAFPFIFYQLWLFIKPGLKNNEISAVNGISIGTSLLFFGGVCFGYFVLAPLSVRFLGTYEFAGAVMRPNVMSYIKLVASLSLATGIIFQLPVVIYFLAKIGIVTPEGLRKYRKHTLVAVLILAAVITPPDVFSQVLVAFPVLILYEFSIRIAARVQKKEVSSETAVR
ncbi:MAG: twin-arginine translocase subunit TatC [Flavobacteriales bacterium]|jgi:sec-independent protein translocase protein TatC